MNLVKSKNKLIMKSNIKRLMECVKSVGGEVFFGECDPTAAGYTVIDTPFVKAAPYDKDEEINIRTIMCEGDMLCLIGEDAEGNIIDSLDVNDIYDEGIEDIIDTIGEEKECLWLRVGVTLKGTRKEIETILADGDNSSETLWNLLQTGKFEIDGETYIPSCTIEYYNDDNGTDFDTCEINFNF